MDYPFNPLQFPGSHCAQFYGLKKEEKGEKEGEKSELDLVLIELVRQALTTHFTS